jgi:hypothetical protein
MAIKTISGTCEITTGAFTPVETSPVYQLENGATLLRIELTENGAEYTLTGDQTAWVKMYFKGNNTETEYVSMSKATGLIYKVLPTVLTAVSGQAVAMIKIVKGSTIIVTCEIPVPIKRTSGTPVTSYEVPSEGTVEYLEGLIAEKQDILSVDGVTIVNTDNVLSVNLDQIPYSNGSFTPELYFGAAESPSIAYVTNTGRYQIVGNILFWGFEIKLSNKGTGTGSATIVGFPQTARAGIGRYNASVGSMTCFSLPAECIGLGLDINPSSSVMYITQHRNDLVTTTLNNTNFTNSTLLRAEGFYFI